MHAVMSESVCCSLSSLTRISSRAGVSICLPLRLSSLGAAARLWFRLPRPLASPEILASPASVEPQAARVLRGLDLQMKDRKGSQYGTEQAVEGMQFVTPGRDMPTRCQVEIVHQPGTVEGIAEE